MKVELYADTTDAFVNLIHKKLRNKKKKLEKVQQLEAKVLAKEIKPNGDQLGMLSTKDGLKQEMDELEDIKSMYKSAFPENPVWAQLSKKKKKVVAKTVETAAVTVTNE